MNTPVQRAIENGPMTLYTGNKKFEVYRLNSKEDLLVAIPGEYKEIIGEAIAEYGIIQNVPVDKTVRGIFLNHNEGTFELNTDEPQNDIVMNQLIIS